MLCKTPLEYDNVQDLDIARIMQYQLNPNGTSSQHVQQ